MSSSTISTPPVVRPDAAARHRERFLILLLVALAAVSRLPFIGSDPGEADCARFLIGLRQWMDAGPHAHAMYGSVFSPLYYWLAAHLSHGFGVAPLRSARLLNALSASAAILTVPVAYRLARFLVSARVAFWSTLAFLATPSFWWLGIETHPQGLSLLGFLASLFCLAQCVKVSVSRPPLPAEGSDPRLRNDEGAHPRRSATGHRGASILWGTAGVLALTAGLGFKSDLVLLFGAFPALALALHLILLPASPTAPDAMRWDWKHRLPPLLPGLLLPGLASVLFLGLRSLLLRHGFMYLQHESGGALAEFLEWPRGGQMIKQLLPMATAFGLLVGLLTATGVVRAMLRWTTGTGPLVLVAAGWSLPSFLFWFLIRGNNVRHMADILLPLLWLGLQGWENLRRPVFPILVLAAIVLDFWTIPPSSNLTLYPSANVPASLHDLDLRMNEIRQESRYGHTTTNGHLCYLGNATLPYLELQLWNAMPDATLSLQPGIQVITLADGRKIDFVEVNSSSQYRRAVAQCPRRRSLEYAPDGSHQWFLGREWRSLPFHRRWYATRYPDPAR